MGRGSRKKRNPGTCVAQDSGAILESPDQVEESRLQPIPSLAQIFFSPEGILENQELVAPNQGDTAPAETHVSLPALQEFPSIPERHDKKGNPIPPPHQEVADHIAAGLGMDLMRDVDDPFYWVGTHWVAKNPKNFKRYAQNIAQGLRMGAAKLSELNSIYELFMNRARALPDHQTFYQQNPFLANFLDGTLEVVKESGGQYTKRFREHAPEDLLTWVLPYRYMDERPQNELFTEWIMKAFANDPDGAGKVRALKQIGGACLVSLFPRVCFLLSDQGGTGKSTFAKLCMKFMGKDNYSSVPPHLMEGFHMESMIGKQANIVTDIGKKAVIPEDFMKLVEDSLPILVNRKGRTAIHARVPALHLFCANALPRGIDGESSAMNRRVTIVEFKTSMLGDDGQSYTRDYEEVLMAAGHGAILQFFEEGLDDLLESGGLYFNPDSGKEKLKEWKDAESFTAQIVQALQYKELGSHDSPLVSDPGGRILRSKFADAVNTWAGKPLAAQYLGRIYRELEIRGYPTKLLDGRPYIHGVRESGINDNIKPVNSSF